MSFPQNLKPGQRVKSFNSPELDFLFFEVVDSFVGQNQTPPEVGTAHPNTLEFPNHKFMVAAPYGEDPKLQRWYYAADRESQDNYNFLKDKNKVVRKYVMPRSDFVDPDYADEPTLGDDDPTFSGYVYTGPERQVTTGDNILDNYFVIVERVYVNANQVLSQNESGNRRGGNVDEVTLGESSTAVASDGGLVVRRSSSQGDDRIWKNTESRLSVREGVSSLQVNKGVGFKELRYSGQSLTKPFDSDDYSAFSRSLVTVDVDGEDALWDYQYSKREREPAVGYETSRFLGGGIATRELDLVDDTTPAQEGFHVLQSKVNPIGNGQAIKDTLTLPQYTPLIDYKFDNTLNGFIKITKTPVKAEEVADGTLVGVRNPDGSIEEIQSYDKWRSIHMKTEGLGVAVTEYLPGVFNYRFPPILNSASWIGSYALAASLNKRDWDFDIALVFDVTEPFSAAVDGRIIRIVTNDPSAIVGDYPPIVFKPQSHTIGVVHSAFYASPAMVWAKASARTWQTPMALCAGINLTPPLNGAGGSISVNGQYSSSTIPATSPTGIPSGWITVGITTNRLKLGYYEVLIRQIDSPG